MDVKLGNNLLFNITPGGSFANGFGITNIAPGVTVTVGGITPNGDKNQFNQSQLYKIFVSIPEPLMRTITNKDLYFYLPQYYNWYIDNVTLNSVPPLAQDPLSISGTTSCPTGLFIFIR